MVIFGWGESVLPRRFLGFSENPNLCLRKLWTKIYQDQQKKTFFAVETCTVFSPHFHCQIGMFFSPAPCADFFVSKWFHPTREICRWSMVPFPYDGWFVTLTAWSNYGYTPYGYTPYIWLTIVNICGIFFWTPEATWTFEGLWIWYLAAPGNFIWLPHRITPIEPDPKFWYAGNVGEHITPGNLV